MVKFVLLLLFLQHSIFSQDLHFYFYNDLKVKNHLSPLLFVLVGILLTLLGTDFFLTNLGQGGKNKSNKQKIFMNVPNDKFLTSKAFISTVSVGTFTRAFWMLLLSFVLGRS